jgi:predicted N-acetyltransferase YhbS
MPAIRPMTPADIPAAAALCAANGWTAMAEHFAFYLAHPHSHPFVAESGGVVVGTAVATVRGPAGWIGLIAVHEQYRRRGLGEALTRHVMDCLRAHGCRTLLLFATVAGRPLYERLGFAVETEYRLLAGPARLPRQPEHASLQPLTPRDLPELLALDHAVTAEDRASELQTYARQQGGWVVRGAGGGLTGFLLQAPWGGTAITATEPEAGRLLLAADRTLTATDGQATATCALPEGNREGLAWLEQAGFHTARISPRMLWGEPLPWRPAGVWSRLSGAMG